jgi:hypothetical protein
MRFLLSFYSKVTEWFNVMYIQSLPVFFWSFSTAPAKFVALSSRRPLWSPGFSIISIVATKKSWMRIPANIFRAPFAVALAITKKVILFVFAITNLFSSNWFSAVFARLATVAPIFNNIFPSRGATAFSGTMLNPVMRTMHLKIFAAPFTFFDNKAAVITKRRLSNYVKRLLTFITNTDWGFAIRHNSIINLYDKFSKEYIK